MCLLGLCYVYVSPNGLHQLRPPTGLVVWHQINSNLIKLERIMGTFKTFSSLKEPINCQMVAWCLLVFQAKLIRNVINEKYSFVLSWQTFSFFLFDLNSQLISEWDTIRCIINLKRAGPVKDYKKSKLCPYFLVYMLTLLEPTGMVVTFECYNRDFKVPPCI